MKTFIIDTNVILDNYRFVFELAEQKDSTVVIPAIVIKELEKFKSEEGIRGYNARAFAREFDVEKAKGSGTTRIKKENIFIDGTRMVAESPDLEIIEVCKTYSEPKVLLTNDTYMILQAKMQGIEAEQVRQEVNEDYTGVSILEVSDIIVQDWGEGKPIFINDEKLNPNQIVVLKADGHEGSIGEAVYQGAGKPLSRIKPSLSLLDLKPKNKEQNWLMNLGKMLTKGDIDLLTIEGPAGCGKTLLAVAIAIDMFEQGKVTNITLTKPVAAMGNQEVGFLKGGYKEKIRPFMQSYVDILEKLGYADMSMLEENIEEIKNKGQEKKNPIQFDALTFIRGRNLKDIILVDECFPYEQKVITSEGMAQIGSLVHKYTRGDVMPDILSFNTDTGAFEYKPFVAGTHKGIRPLVEVRAGNSTLKCTEDHPVLTTHGWKKVNELEIGDLLVRKGKKLQSNYSLNSDQIQVVIGSMLGDGSQKLVSPSSMRVRLIHGAAQEQYIRYKANAFGTKVTKILDNGFSKKEAYTTSTKTFGTWRPMIEGVHDVRFPRHLIEDITERGLAIWFMDDGSGNGKNSAQLHTQGFTLEQNEFLVELLKTKFDLNAEITKTYNKKRDKEYNLIRFTKEDYLKLSKLIAPYVIESLSYKVANYKENLGGSKTEINNKYLEFTTTPFKEMVRLEEEEHVFDIEVADNHNFIAINGAIKKDNLGGFVVHNCQNLNKHEIKTLLTRADEGAKVILIGDTDQIDAKYLNSKNNGLSYVVKQLQESDFTAHIKLLKSERSRLAELAGRKL